jgi:hypothetical protein
MRRDLHTLDAKKNVLALVTLERDDETRLRAEIDRTTRHQVDPTMLDFINQLTRHHV